MTHTKPDLLDLGVNWQQITSQGGLDTSQGYGFTGSYPWYIDPSVYVWDPFRFLSTSSNPALNWLWGRMVYYAGRPDVSDSGMVYYFFTGNQYGTPADLQALLDPGGGGGPAGGYGISGPSWAYAWDWVAVDWTAPSGHPWYDWVNISPDPNACDWDTWGYTYLYSTDTAGMVWLTAPGPGHYYVKYLDGDSCAVRASYEIDVY